MKLSMTLGEMTISDHEVDKWPENPMATIAAYLKDTYPDVFIWITDREHPKEGVERMTWRKPDETLRNPVGDPCASLTISA
jgi:hypothetical protein